MAVANVAKMKMSAIFGLSKMACVVLLSTVIAVHIPSIIKPPHAAAVAIQTAPEVTQQLASEEQQLIDMQRRIQSLEQANIAVQLAALQSEVNIDHQILLAMALMMFTLAIEALWRMAGKSKTRSTD